MPPPPKPPPTRSPRKKPAANRTPVEILEQHERKQQIEQHKHWQACGQQITSVRPTCPGYSFGFRATQVKTDGRITWEQLDVLQTLSTTSIPDVGGCDIMRPQDKSTKLMILPGWGTTPRGFFERDDGSDTYSGYQAQVRDTHASYAEAAGADPAGFPPNVRAAVVEVSGGQFGTAGEQGSGQSGAGDDTSASAASGAPAPSHSPRARKHGGGKDASGTFGSASLGYRFKKDTQFSRKAPCITNSRLNTFRDMRSQITDADLISLAAKRR